MKGRKGRDQKAGGDAPKGGDPRKGAVAPESGHARKGTETSSRASAAAQASAGGRRAAGGGRRGWLATHGRDLKFLGLFALFLVIFYLLTITPYAQNTVFPGYLRLNAIASAAILDAAGEGVEARENSLMGRRFALTIERGCDAVQPAALFCAAVLASPVPLVSRLMAVVVGTAFLMVLNLARILSLYYVGAYYRRAFDVMHLDVWQAMFIVLALLFWGLWASWAVNRQKKKKGRSADASA